MLRQRHQLVHQRHWDQRTVVHIALQGRHVRQHHRQIGVVGQGGPRLDLRCGHREHVKRLAGRLEDQLVPVVGPVAVGLPHVRPARLDVAVDVVAVQEQQTARREPIRDGVRVLHEGPLSPKI